MLFVALERKLLMVLISPRFERRLWSFLLPCRDVFPCLRFATQTLLCLGRHAYYTPEGLKQRILILGSYQDHHAELTDRAKSFQSFYSVLHSTHLAHRSRQNNRTECSYSNRACAAPTISKDSTLMHCRARKDAESCAMPACLSKHAYRRRYARRHIADLSSETTATRP